MKKSTMALVVSYFLCAITTYGHFWNNSDIEWNELNKPIVAFIVSVAHPLYWSTVAFEKDE